MDPVIMSQVASRDYTVTGLAKFSERFFAFITDLFVLYVPLGMLEILLAAAASTPIVRAITLILVSFFGIMAYFSIVAYSRGGQTWGKSWNKITLLDSKGNTVTLGRIILREFIARGLFVLLSLFLGYLSYLWFLTYLPALRKNRRALHDIIAGTQVVKLRGQPLTALGNDECLRKG